MVYVDDYRGQFRGMVMCHMVADSLDELHAFAERLGLRREWFQATSVPHYDLSLTRRKLALELGAVEVRIRCRDGSQNPRWREVFGPASRARAAARLHASRPAED